MELRRGPVSLLLIGQHRKSEMSGKPEDQPWETLQVRASTPIIVYAFMKSDALPIHAR